jgi:hypothetical protein
MLQMRSTKYRLHNGSSGFRGFVTAITIAFVAAGCTSAPATVRMEPKSIAKQIGFPYCKVSVPLSQSEVIEEAKRMDIPDPEKYVGWIKMKSNIQPGDQLRLVNFFTASRSKYGEDPYYYALIRNGKIISEFHIAFSIRKTAPGSTRSLTADLFSG